MTHAARTHDIFELLTEARDRLDELLEAEAKREEDLKKAESERQKAEAELHARIAMANAVRLMRQLSRKSRIEGADRDALTGAAEQLEKVAV
jgi:hypothetical protein